MTTPGPETTSVHDAEVTFFRQAPRTDDASDMYVVDVLGVSLLVRLVREDGRVYPRIMIEARSPYFEVGVNESITGYGEYPPEDEDNEEEEEYYGEEEHPGVHEDSPSLQDRGIELGSYES